MSVPLRVEQFVVMPTQSGDCFAAPVPKRVSRHVRKFVAISVISGVLSILALAAVGAMTLLHGLGGGPELCQVASSANTHMSSTVGSVRRANGYVTVVGTVENLAGAGASQVVAVVELTNSENHAVQVEKAMLPYSKVEAGHSSPFCVVVPDDAGAVGYRISFTRADGQAI